MAKIIPAEAGTYDVINREGVYVRNHDTNPPIMLPFGTTITVNGSGEGTATVENTVISNLRVPKMYIGYEIKKMELKKGGRRKTRKTRKYKRKSKRRHH